MIESVPGSNNQKQKENIISECTAVMYLSGRYHPSNMVSASFLADKPELVGLIEPN